MRRISVVAGALCVSACTLLLGFEDGHERSTTPDEAGLVDGGEAGTIVTDSVAVTPAVVDFGTIGCGAGAPPPRSIQLKSVATAPVKYSAELRGSPSFSISGASAGEIAPGATATITVATSVPNGAAAGEVLLAVAGDLVHVQLLANAGGAQLAVTPPTCDFGKVRVDTEAMRCAVTLANVGQSAAAVALPGATAPFTLTWDTTPATLEADASVTGALGFHPTTATPANAKIDFVSTTTLCAAPPSLTATGLGSNDPVVVQPGTLEFGSMACGTTPAPKNVTVQNFNVAAITYNPVLVSGSAFTVSAGGTVQPDGGATITVSPKPVTSTAPGAISDTLNVSTNGPGDSPHVVPIHATTEGAVLAFTPANLGLLAGQTKPFSLANTGNATVTVKLSLTAGSGGTFSITPSTGQVLPAGGSLSGTVHFAALGPGTVTGGVQVTVVGGPFCVNATPMGLAGTK